MEALLSLFPPNDVTLLAFIVLLPLIGAAINGIFGKRLGKEAVVLMGLTAIGVSFLLSVIAFFMLQATQTEEHAAHLAWKGWDWITLDTGFALARLSVSFSIDALSGTMALVVTGVGFLIHLYSWKYMEEDPGFHRFFAYLNLFIFSMLVLILGDSLPVLFVGWEGVGLCSYLLIGFWFDGEQNAAAGKKAFITNRIGDFGLLVAMGLILLSTGALDWNGIEANRMHLLDGMQIFPNLGWLGLPNGITVSRATLVGLALFLGCAGKSAQIPLYVWLPDAMAGPTPVSALIHAATMVTAGVYLVCRLSFVFVLSPFVMWLVAVIGACTALFAATIAFAQNDIKKVLAYSTVSQLGYMFLGVGVGAFTAGFFHVITHAFFKACLFLGAGSVIHAMHARIHDNDQSQDMRNMGGLRRYLPITFFTFLASWAAISGIPGTSGFFSKDEILLSAFSSHIGSEGHLIGGQEPLWEWPKATGPVLYAIGLLTAVMTAFYMSRLFFGIFYGEFRGWKISKKWHAPHGHDHHHHEHETPGPSMKGPEPHESPWQMWVPLAILGTLAVVAGFLNAHLLKIDLFDEWLAPVFKTASSAVVRTEDVPEFAFVGAAVAACVAGIGGAYWVYIAQKGAPARAFAEGSPGLYRLVQDKWRIDEFYEETFIGGVDLLAVIATAIDKWVVDLVIARFVSGVIAFVGGVLRFAQTGRVQAYAFTMVLGMGGLGWFFFVPHAAYRLDADDLTGKYTVHALPGASYQYLWDEDGDGKWDDDGKFGNKRDVSFELKPDETKTVRLAVRNAFGLPVSRDITVHRPRPDLSGADPNAIQVLEPGASGKPPAGQAPAKRPTPSHP
ncbi:MAG TPA: NADH-quinone oxidoreductase subunit L [Polyangiaceae bacterium]|nr:NADH-quinone oxidoreductase subunit L [Polyangiaceae bacterium]